MERKLIENLESYASRRDLVIAERLGFGIHGMVYVAKNKSKMGKTAIKAHSSVEPFLRECRAYDRLRDAGCNKLLGFNVPELVGIDEELFILEMTIVIRPFVLDFAGAYLDAPPHFSDEIWADWEAQKRDQFEDRWPTVQNVLSALEELDIYMIDVTPNNIAFLD
jgi:hypothetical protein